MIQTLNLWQVDAFTKEPFKGNPAAVIVLYEEICDELMQTLLKTTYLKLLLYSNVMVRILYYVGSPQCLKLTFVVMRPWHLRIFI